MTKLIECRDATLFRDTIDALELLRKFIGNEITRLADERSQPVARGFVEGHASVDFLPLDPN